MHVPSHIKEHRRWRRRSQQGQIVLVTALLLGLVITVSLFGIIRPNSVNLEDVAQTERALAQAKEALIAYAAGRLANRPGELPCPDRTNNGQATPPNCNTPATQIGRLPWFTLGIPDLRDGSGERLWYAVSNNFKNATAITPLNSNTLGQLTVNGITPTNNVIAIVFAPGAVVAGQSRTAANLNNVAHYLEGENANGDTIFTTATPSSTFNDKLLAITPALFFPAVEMSVARRLRQRLNTYYAATLWFPPANSYGVSCVPADQGWIPQAPATCGVAGGQTVEPLSSDLTINQWFQTLFYAVAPACRYPAINCTGAGGFLTVNGVGGVRALIITPGIPFAGQTRPCASSADCLEAPNTTSFPAFTHTTGSPATNDRVIIVSP
jgi:hypothetical protein